MLIARINLLLTFLDYYEERWERLPDEKLLQQMANKIAWNIWQMDGLKDTVPLGKPYEEYKQMCSLIFSALRMRMMTRRKLCRVGFLTGEATPL